MSGRRLLAGQINGCAMESETHICLSDPTLRPLPSSQEVPAMYVAAGVELAQSLFDGLTIW